MTKRHYVALAAALGATLATYKDGPGRAGVLAAVAAIIPVLAADNPRFDRERFIDAVHDASLV